MKKHKKRNHNHNNNRRKKQTMEFTGLSVHVYNGNISRALSDFKRMVKESGLMIDIKKKSYYKKKSEKLRELRNYGKLKEKYRAIKEKNATDY
jgi:ribosomal protein S21